MGCDGGTIPRRDELVRLKKKPEQKDKEAELEFRWRHCALTQERLQEPIVMCGLGRLYSKQNVIEHLLEKDKMPESAKHIKSLRDVKDLKLTPNPIFDAAHENQGGSTELRSAPYICKLIGLEMGGKFRFIALWDCGCVYSERAFKELKSKVCSLCQTPYNEADVVILNGSEADIDLMRVKLEARAARRKVSKKNKQKASTSTAIETVQESSTETEVKEEAGPEAGPSSSNGKPGALKIVSKPTKRLTAEKLVDPAFKKAKQDYSVAKDPKATDVYKSLFTSHKSEKDQDRAHWVTYNPFYN